MKPHRLAVITSHPIQYQAPLWRRLAASPEIDLTVFFCSTQGIVDGIDPEFGVKFKWDVPLLDGYAHRFLTNLAPAAVRTGPFHAVNPGIIRALSRGRFDAVLVHGYALATYWIGIASARCAGIPVLLRGETVLRDDAPGPRLTLKRAALRALLRSVTVCLPIGSRSADFYRFFGVPDSRLFLTPYAVDNEFFRAEHEKWKMRRLETRAALGIPQRVPVVLYAGKLTQRKCPQDLLEAFSQLDGNAWLLFVGDGELLPALKARADTLPQSRVMFTGFKNQSELPAFYAMSDVFVLPSSYEPWGLAINEAMCFELPIVTTNRVAAAADLVRPGENGWVLSVGDRAALKDALSAALADSARRAAMGRRSVERITGWGLAQSAAGIVDGVKAAVAVPGLAAEAG